MLRRSRLEAAYLESRLTSRQQRRILSALRRHGADVLEAQAARLLRQLPGEGEPLSQEDVEAIREWESKAAAYLETLHRAAAMAVLGPNLAPEMEGLLAASVARQERFLAGFTADVISGRQARNGTLAPRAAMYGRVVWATAQNLARQAALRTGQFVQERRVHLGQDPPCPTCVTEAAKGWQPLGTLRAIGDSECKSGCHCVFEFKGRTRP